MELYQFFKIKQLDNLAEKEDTPLSSYSLKKYLVHSMETKEYGSWSFHDISFKENTQSYLNNSMQ